LGFFDVFFFSIYYYIYSFFSKYLYIYVYRFFTMVLCLNGFLLDSSTLDSNINSLGRCFFVAAAAAAAAVAAAAAIDLNEILEDAQDA